MTGANAVREPSDEQLAPLALASLLLRWRRGIAGLCVAGAIIGLTSGLLTKRQYQSRAIFLPQSSELGASAAGLALAASQLGIRVPAASGTWGPPVYAALLRSRALLAPIATDTFAVEEEGGRRVALMDLLHVSGSNAAERLDRGVLALAAIVDSREVRPLGAVELSVTTRWPSVSLAIADRLVAAVQRFNVETRKSQAMAERQFAETRAAEAERTLREAEDRLQRFLQRNRVLTGSAELAFERDRLQRDVNLRQQVYTGLSQNREEARLREVRDTPVITVIEHPQLPALPMARRSVLRAALGTLGGGLLGVLSAFLIQGLAFARSAPSERAREFFRLLDEATPKVFRRRMR